jgi:LytS/YehU family sensor histidine kinase
VALDAVADAQSVAGYAKVLLAENTRLRERLTREKEWAESELASQNEVGMKNLQELIQATGEIKALRATVEALHAILGKKEYEIQMLREKIAPLLSQEEKCT